MGVPIPGTLLITKGVSLDPSGPFVPRVDTFIGTTVYYRITVLNDGNDTLTAVTLIDSLTDLSGWAASRPRSRPARTSPAITA